MTIHIVQSGDTIYSIAAQYGVSPQRLMYDNQIEFPESLVLGQALLILIPEQIHTVQSGQTLFSIASSYGISTLDLVRNNPFLVNAGSLFEGQQLTIQFEGEKDGIFSINGYAYPFINRNLLSQTLLYLTDLSIFSYGFTPEGELIIPDDTALIQAARQFGVRPILVLTPLNEMQSFDSNLISNLVNSNDAQDNLINNLLQVMQDKGYAGIDVDFEYINADNKDAYVEFLQVLTTTMNNNGYTVSVALAPKTSAQQRGILYEGIDYARIGAIVNSVLLMTYEWGYKYGPPMAVAPINNVRRVVQYGVSEIPAYKIDLGIPNYGYDWPLPFVQGQTEARTIGNLQAVNIALQNGAQIQYDQTAQAPFFEYTDNGIDHIVWFEDVRSISQKIDLMQEFELHGAGYWNIMYPFLPNWLTLNNRIIIQ